MWLEWGEVGKGVGDSLDVRNESTSLSLPEDVAETDSSAAANYRLSSTITNRGEIEMVSTGDNTIQRLVNR